MAFNGPFLCASLSLLSLLGLQVLSDSLISPLVLEAYSQILDLCFSIHKDGNDHRDGKSKSQEEV